MSYDPARIAHPETGYRIDATPFPPTAPSTNPATNPATNPTTNPTTNPAAPAAHDEADRGGFRTVDDIARDPTSTGFVVVRSSHSVLEALSVHIARRARARGRAPMRVDGALCDDVWRELAARLGVSACTDPIATAEAIVTRARTAVIILVDANPTSWGRAVAEEIARVAAAFSSKALFLYLSEGTREGTSARRVVEVDQLVGGEDVRRWWDAIAQDAERLIAPCLDRLDALEGWWSGVRTMPLKRWTAPAVPELSEAATRLLTRILLSQRSWSWEHLERLGTVESRDELVARGVLELDIHRRLSVAGTVPLSPPIEPLNAIQVAEALDALPRSDPWATIRASELYAAGGAPDRAEAAAARAILSIVDVAARADFWRRWERSLELLPAEQATARLLRCADLALRVGDVDRALSFANTAVARAGELYETMLTLGRATTARGDLTTAAFVLGKAMKHAPHAPARARAAVEMAEVRYMAGELDEARRHAEEGFAEAGDLATRLQARNVIGKLHLANARWSEAEQHFAADACEAACGGDIIGDLRARLNRAIALLSSGRYDEARSMLTSVLEEGEARGELSAISFALTNLATIAILKHEYATALSLSERAFEVRRRIGDKIRVALLITNLAELRLQIGLIAEAEQALAFGRQACRPGMPAARAAHFALVAARIHLARGNTLDAAAEVASAMASALGSSNGDKLCECHRLAARIALEDGDLSRAESSIEGARREASSGYAKAEVALLEAMLARAAGQPFRGAVDHALSLAREGDAIELQREAHTLAYHAALIESDVRDARGHLQAALNLRKHLADSLPEELRNRFLARRDLAELAHLERSLTGLAVEDTAESAARSCSRCGQVSCGGCARRAARLETQAGEQLPALRRMVGRDPAILSLISAVQKVGQSDATVLIQGESGTGKELVAEAIHEASPRRSGPMVKVNCAALVETLLLSELFGHEKGSFTGAMARRRGRFELAEGGTLFLDEIGDISPHTQVALLRVLQNKTFERVGGVTPLRANVRILCATHRDLRAMVARGEFREDLYYRLRGFVLEVPALRQRMGDLLSIASAILERIADERGTATKRLSARALEGLATYSWPGNVRELENALRAAALFAEADTIELDDFTNNVEGLRTLARTGTEPSPVHEAPDDEDDDRPSSVVERRASAVDRGSWRASNVLNVSDVPPAPDSSMRAAELPFGPQGSRSEQDLERTPTDVAYAHVRAGTSLSDLKRTIERDCIARALAESRGNITRAAVLLGMKRPRLSQLVKQYGFGGVSED